jgi:hypothetical protein
VCRKKKEPEYALKERDRKGQVHDLNVARQTQVLCILLVLQGVVSFRCVPRLLSAVNVWGGNIFTWLPHFTSVINWTLRMGVGLLNTVGYLSQAWIALMDTSMTIGTKKVLVVLRVSLEALGKKGQAIELVDCECIGVRVLAQCNGETIRDCLIPIFNQAGVPVAILKDQGGDLGKGVKLYQQAQHQEGVQVIDDIGHELANGLKAQYQDQRMFARFLNMVRRGGAQIRQTPWAFLIPPKLRIKGRFQSIGKLAAWASRVLEWLKQPVNDENEDETAKVIRKAFTGLLGYREFVQRFAHTTQIVHAVLKVLKHDGLNQVSYEQCQSQAQALGQRSKVKKRLLNWLHRHEAVQHKLTQLTGQSCPLLVSTDILESLFGKYKRIIERTPSPDINRMALIIPTLCGPTLTPERIEQLLRSTQQKDISIWEQNNIVYTLRKKRKEFFSKILKKGTKKREISLADTG